MQFTKHPLSPSPYPLPIPTVSTSSRMFLTLASVWVLLSLAGSILRLFSLRLLADTTYLDFISYPNLTNLSK